MRYVSGSSVAGTSASSPGVPRHIYDVHKYLHIVLSANNYDTIRVHASFLTMFLSDMGTYLFRMDLVISKVRFISILD